MKYADLERLVEISDLVVHGRVLERDTHLDSAHNRVVTDTTIELQRVVMGEASETVTIRQWGGELDGKVYSVAGDATFEDEEEVVVFLKRGTSGHEAGRLYLSALAQSKFSVQRRDGRAYVSRDLSDISFRDSDERETAVLRGTREFDSFLAELESLVYALKPGASPTEQGGNR